jgi:hypothetical protein
VDGVIEHAATHGGRMRSPRRDAAACDLVADASAIDACHVDIRAPAR